MGLRQNILEDPISDLAVRDLVAVERGTPVRSVVDQMRKRRVGCAIVVDGQGKPVGKFTERKLMKLLLQDSKSLDEPIDRFMYTDADCIPQSEPIAVMVQKMKTRKLRFICLVDETGRAVALTGQRGLMEYISEHFPRQIKVQNMDPKLNMEHREGA